MGKKNKTFRCKNDSDSQAEVAERPRRYKQSEKERMESRRETGGKQKEKGIIFVKIKKLRLGREERGMT